MVFVMVSHMVISMVSHMAIAMVCNGVIVGVNGVLLAKAADIAVDQIPKALGHDSTARAERSPKRFYLS